MKQLYQNLTILAFSLLACTSSAQIVAETSMPIDSLVQEIFNTGTFVEVSNITFNGVAVDDTMTNVQIGYFANGFSDGLPIDSGFAMTTGNMADDFINEFSGPVILDEYEDNDIFSIAGVQVNDCAVLEFDVLNLAEALAFSYTFASTEYESFTCTSYNDAFGLFISGPGLSGPFENGAINIATIPDSDTPIAINTVNGGVPTGSGVAEICENANSNWIEDSQYFIQNYGNSVSNITFNGFTVNLEAFVEVEQDQTYHIKFAICDATDGALNSGIILEANSFEGRFLSSTEDRKKESLTMYPNPAREIVNIVLPEASLSQFTTVRILDVRGRVVKSETFAASGTVTLSTTEVEKGFYIIEALVNNEVVATSKLIRD